LVFTTPRTFPPLHSVVPLTNPPPGLNLDKPMCLQQLIFPNWAISFFSALVPGGLFLATPPCFSCESFLRLIGFPWPLNFLVLPCYPTFLQDDRPGFFFLFLSLNLPPQATQCWSPHTPAANLLFCFPVFGALPPRSLFPVPPSI